MHKKYIVYILSLTLSSSIFIGCTSKTKNINQANQPNTAKASPVEINPLSPDKIIEDNKLSDPNESFKRKSSGIVTSVPWESDASFRKAQKESGAYVLMAAYCTVLPDPSPGEEENVHIGAKKLTGVIIEPGTVFSQNKTIGPYTIKNGYKEGPTYSGSRLIKTIGGGVCKISTTLYNVAIMSNLQIVERHYHGMPVSYAPYGQDATVSYGTFDLRFKNNTDFPILIWTQTIDNILYIGFYGKNNPPRVEWHHEITDIKKTTTIYKPNPKLPPGTKKLVIIGGDGAKVKSWVTIEQSNGSVITKNLGMSYYRPLPYIYEVGSEK